jgi:transcriptional regulator with XRE-family HTH domain
MDTFGDVLRRNRTAAGLSLRSLSALVNYDYGYLGQIERGDRQASAALAAACDTHLHAGGALQAAYQRQIRGGDMQRRTVLRTIGALAAGAGPAAVTLESLRQGIDTTLGNDHDEWRQIVADYGHAFYRLPPNALLDQLAVDLHVLRSAMAVQSGRRPYLSTVAAQLSVLVALLLAGAGDQHQARRWWATANRAADRSGDLDTRILVGAWQVVNGCYNRQPVEQAITLSDPLTALAAGRWTAAAAGLYAGLAQALAAAGRHDEAATCVRTVADITDRLPAHAAADVDSLWGWPEHRLRHTESYVYTHIGHLAHAEVAQDRALALYPAVQTRLRAQVELHRAARLIRGGDIPDGLRHAADVLDVLPTDQHNGRLYGVARQVIAAVPAADCRRHEVAELEARLPE